MQYWINHNGVQSGPVDLDGLKEMSLTSAAYVWHEGLNDWVKITQLPELQGLYEMVEAPVAPQQATEVTPMLDGENGPVAEGLQVQPDQQPQVDNQPMQQVAPPPCPSTNLVWAIVATVFCCVPFGIMAIVYANKVTKLYTAGDFYGAESASETSMWWTIAAIMAGVVWRPLLYTLIGT